MNEFEKFISELMYAEVYLSVSGSKSVCHFNHFRSFQKYLYFCNCSLEKVWHGLNKKELCPTERRFLLSRLEHVGRLFTVERETVVTHRHLVVYEQGVPVAPDSLSFSSRCLLLSYLNIQYDAWRGLCRLCENFLTCYQGDYVWKGDLIELLELGDALWSFDLVEPLGGEKSKKSYFQRLFSFFNLPVPEDPCRRLGELGKRALPHAFLTRLSEYYCRYWQEREG